MRPFVVLRLTTTHSSSVRVQASATLYGNLPVFSKMPLAPVDDAGTVLFFEDSGPPPPLPDPGLGGDGSEGRDREDTYDTIVCSISLDLTGRVWS